MMKARTSLWASLAIAASVGLAGCGGSSNNDDPEPTPEVTPEPDAATTQRTGAQGAASTASTAAKKASDDADADAGRAETATADLATLQTGATAGDLAAEARKYADMAKAEYDKAAAASTAAAAETTASAAGAQQGIAEAAQAAAEGHAAMAKMKADEAVAAAATEVSVTSALISSGGADVSSVNPDVERVIDPADPTDTTSVTTTTGHLGDIKRIAGAVKARAFANPTPPAADVGYKQAVEARSLAVGKELDTTDDKARIRMFHGYAGSEKVSVYVLGDASTNIFIRTDRDGDRLSGSSAPSADPSSTTELAVVALDWKSEGMHYRATEPSETAFDGNSAITASPAGAVDNTLESTDLIQAKTKAREVFSYIPTGTTNRVFVVEIDRDVDTITGYTDVTYQRVDTEAVAAPDGLADTRQVPASASLPKAMQYSHINFGVWASLSEEAKSAPQKVTDIGIGWVDNIDDSGINANAGVSKATYNGDWVATIKRRNSGTAGSFTIDDGKATLVADFVKDEFTGTLDGLATLEGTLSEGVISGTKATDIRHANLTPSGTFEGSFSGGVYGADGSETAGIFHFDGGNAGAFSGSFGGKETGAASQ